MAEKRSDDEACLVPVRRRVVVLDTGERLERRTVHCPLTGLQVVDACVGCERLVSLDDTGEHETVRCHVRQPVSAAVTVDEALGPDSWCLDPELPVSTAVGLLESQRLSSAPVVDDAGVIIGIVRLTSLRALEDESRALRLRHPSADEAVTDEALEPALGVLSPDEPLANAAEKMAAHQVSELPVIEPDGSLVGVLKATDVLRFFGRR
ncbi:MAG: CBS domain-containing protein [Myxococcaceae bacterium]|jgi:CBS domain-containing protein|nr:CBS domain-containing protein [Myxococcaceae bacterium]